MLGAWRNGDGAGLNREFAGLIGFRALGIAKIVQSIDELLGAQRLANAELERPRKDSRQHSRVLAVELRVEKPSELHVVVGGNDCDEH